MESINAYCVEGSHVEGSESHRTPFWRPLGRRNLAIIVETASVEQPFVKVAELNFRSNFTKLQLKVYDVGVAGIEKLVTRLEPYILRDGKPECFAYAEFCEEVCGYTDDELRDEISRHQVKRHVDPIARDMPREPSDRVVRAWEVFRASDYSGIPLRNLSIEDFFNSFSKFREWERQVHPRMGAGFSGIANYFEPAYEKLKDAYKKGDVEGVKREVGALVNLILHK